jgi:hypothetical protein
VRQTEYDRKLNAAIENMNKRDWGDNKTESHRERVIDEYKDELQQQIKEKQTKDSFKIDQKRFQEVEEEKRVKREVFELNNQYLIEDGLEPLTIPQDLLPDDNIQGLYAPDLNDVKSIDPSVQPGFYPEGFQNQEYQQMNNNQIPQVQSISPPTLAQPTYYPQQHDNTNYPQNFQGASHMPYLQQTPPHQDPMQSYPPSQFQNYPPSPQSQNYPPPTGSTLDAQYPELQGKLFLKIL